MDSESLRLILLVLGILLVAGIYFGDRYKRNARVSRRLHLARKLDEPRIDLPEEDDVGEVKVRHGGEPYIDTGTEQAMSAVQPVQLTERFVAELGQAPEPAAWEAREESQRALEFEEFNAHGDSDYLHVDPEMLDEVPRIIVQISIMSSGEPFTDALIREATAEVDMQYGAMDIYHRRSAAGETLFSMAGVVEPGTFPKKPTEAFTTPGMTLFTQLPGVRDGLAIYSDMLFTAERLAVLLNANLHDEAHNKLTKQSIEHTRETILEHGRQVQLLRSRH